MTSPTTTLNEALNSLPVPGKLPSLLPLTHLSVSKWFASTIGAGRLEPRMCSVFKKELTYLFYGGVFYRTENISTRDATRSPVAFVFSPAILDDMLRAFPFDTGAIAGNKAGKWSADLVPIENYEVTNSSDDELISKLVYHFFRENELYLYGEPNPDCVSYPHPFPQVYDFYLDDLTKLGVDQRQTVFECQFDANIQLGKNLLWVGFPENMTLEYGKLRDAVTHDLKFYPYSISKTHNPYATAKMLEEMARKQIIDEFIKSP